MSSTSISNVWSLTINHYESTSHIETIHCSNSGYTRRPGHMKNFKRPSFLNETMVAWSLSASWSFTSCSLSFHSNILNSCQSSNQNVSHLTCKKSLLGHQHAKILKTEHFNAGTSLVTHVDNTFLTLSGHVEMHPPLAALQCVLCVMTMHYQHGPTILGLPWNAPQMSLTRVDRNIKILGPTGSITPPKSYKIWMQKYKEVENINLAGRASKMNSWISHNQHHKDQG